MAFPRLHTFRARNIYVYLLFLSTTAHSLMSSYCSVWRTERNVRTANAQGAPSLIRCKPGELNETYKPYERCLRFVTAFTVRTDREAKLRTESVSTAGIGHVCKGDKNIGNFFVRSAFQTSDQPGTFKCARARCKTCSFICNVEKISGPKRCITITDHFTCTSANVIYCITCAIALFFAKIIHRRNRETTRLPIPRTPS